MMNVKAITNLDELINQNLNLSEDIRGEAMTIAEALEQRGREKSQANIAINLLNKGMPAKEIAEVTELDLSTVEQLQQQNTKPHSDKH